MILYPDRTDIIECIPNISEGRDLQLIESLCREISKEGQTQLLAVEVNPDANRSVFTMIGPSPAVFASAQKLVHYCKENIDMSIQKGVHPRIGAVDVCPFVNLGTQSDEKVHDEVLSWAKRTSRNLAIPIYLYENNARNPQRKLLANIRKGNYENLAAKMKSEKGRPDLGPQDFIPTFGAMVTGQRDLMVALNISLPELDLAEVRTIAKQIREGGSHGLKGLRAIGWYLKEYNSSQVSMNITDLESVSLHQIIRQILELAYGNPAPTQKYQTELIGLMPNFYLEQAISDFGAENYKTLMDMIHLQAKAIGRPTIEYQYAHPQEWDTLLALNT